MPVGPKNIVVFCDGTGQDGLITDEAPTAKSANRFTNVLRLSRAVTKTFGTGSKQRPQIVFYQSGVGVATDFKADEVASDGAKKAFGTAVAAKIRDAYNFIAQNYVPGDQIFLFGFSRGAYTARKISGLIDRLGLLSTTEMGKFFTYWKQLNKILPGEPPRPSQPVPIKILGVWDTVGSVFEGTSQQFDALTLTDTKLAGNVETALHALAFHENRGKFLPTLFNGAEENQKLKQLWFPGAHSDVGGGYADHALADVSLAWMVGEIKDTLGIDEKFIGASLTKGTSKPDWGKSTPHNAYDDTSLLTRPVIGHEERLSFLTKDSVLHPSLLQSPDTKGLPTLDKVKKKQPGWNPEDHCAELGGYEGDVKEFWYDDSRDVEPPEFESVDELDSLF